MKMYSLKKRKKRTIQIVILSILGCVWFFFTWFQEKASPKLIHVAGLELNRYILEITNHFQDLLTEEDMDQFLVIRTNEKGDILSMDYDMQKIYSFAEKMTQSLKENIENAHDDQEMHQSGILFFFPLGIVSDSVFLANLGPKIPVYITFLDSVFSNVKTRARDYGINNALVDVYLEIQITYEILTPVTMDEKTFSYELLLDSQVIQGNVPDLYGDYMESRSAFFDISFP